MSPGTFKLTLNHQRSENHGNFSQQREIHPRGTSRFERRTSSLTPDWALVIVGSVGVVAQILVVGAALTEDYQRDKLKRFGVSGYVAKPYRPLDLLHRVRDVLDAS